MKQGDQASRATDPLVRVRWGRDWFVRDGWHFVLQLLPMRSLMVRRTDEGRMTFVGLEVEFGFRRSLAAWVNDAREAFWRPYLRVRSDVSEIASRRAGVA